MAFYRNASSERVNLSYIGLTTGKKAVEVDDLDQRGRKKIESVDVPLMLEPGDIIDLPANIRERTVRNTCPQLKIINFRPSSTGLRGVRPYTLGEAKTFYWMPINDHPSSPPRYRSGTPSGLGLGLGLWK